MTTEAETAFSDEYWMQHALRLAEQAAAINEVPVGAVVVLGNAIVGSGYNQMISASDPTAHAEIIALRHAAQALDNYRLINATLYVTLEPCSMCAGAMVHGRIARLVYGAIEPKAGVVQSRGEFFKQDFLNHRVATEGGICGDDCSSIISDFFARRRRENRREKKQG